VGLIGQSILAATVGRTHANRSLPPYFQPLLGGWSNLRGFEAGAFAGDTVVAGSLELRVPLSSPLSVGKVGVSLFVDAGATALAGQRIRDQPVHVGLGGGAWLTLTAFRLGVAVARGRDAGTRLNFGAGFGF
jgi:hemolysin activation/secretion protein